MLGIVDCCYFICIVVILFDRKINKVRVVTLRRTYKKW